VRIIEEGCTSVVPLHLLTSTDEEDEDISGKFDLLWPENGRTYAPILIAKGTVDWIFYMTKSAN